MVNLKPRVYLRRGRWCIDKPGYSVLWAWVNTLEGAMYEALQIAVKGYRETMMDGTEPD